jgi:hypothetical protein
MRRTAAPVTAGAAVLCGILLAGCSTDSPTPSPTTASTGPGASTSAPAQPSSPGPTSAAPEPTGTLGPNLDANTAAAFQLCGTSLALAAGFVGQVAPEQLAEGKTAVAAAREAYTDDGSGLLQIVDTLLAAVEDADQATVITSAQELGDACQDYTPGT